MKQYQIFIILVLSVIVTQSCKSQDLKKENKSETNASVSPRIIKGGSIEMLKGRRAYDLAGREISTKHFAVRKTTPENPFKPHKHEQSELWFISSGKGTVILDGVEFEVEANDLIILDPWVEHGLSTTGEVTWICLG
ncbi:cupin domain-containing protein [Aurantibacter crassamenti]|uniref:cupin domain-containing protein n=1 Tax=Aurantibacter crassamenti TaxID=1837375 RepID=UPI00193A439F|nr:cupin domain-containing protein [Aurantibacter crassamenti]MBM1105867.1 cupin domain-containing protein [Aurantibacter crassamenti]